jgi:hypothetical protein
LKVGISSWGIRNIISQNDKKPFGPLPPPYMNDDRFHFPSNKDAAWQLGRKILMGCGWDADGMGDGGKGAGKFGNIQ